MYVAEFNIWYPCRCRHRKDFPLISICSSNWRGYKSIVLACHWCRLRHFHKEFTCLNRDNNALTKRNILVAEHIKFLHMDLLSLLFENRYDSFQYAVSSARQLEVAWTETPTCDSTPTSMFDLWNKWPEFWPLFFFLTWRDTRWHTHQPSNENLLHYYQPLAEEPDDDWKLP